MRNDGMRDDLAGLLSSPTPAEAALLAHAAAGTLCQLSPACPDPADPGAPRIRAALLSHLICGGSAAAPVAPEGVRLIGAVVEGPLQLSFRTAQGETDLRLCAFTHPVAARRASLVQLVLNGSRLPGLSAEGAVVAGSVFLVGLAATGRLSLAHATIGGQLALNGARLAGLTAQGARIGASAYLRAASGTPFVCEGEVSLSGAEIAGQLACDGARFRAPGGIALNLQGLRAAGDVIFRDQGALPFHAAGEVRLSGARIGGQLDCASAEFDNPGGPALSAQRMEVAAEFFWQNVTVTAGSLHLPSARVGDLVDDLASWPAAGRCHLDGFTYDRISRGAPTDAATRLRWLERVAAGPGRFLPQPYGQCARVLHAMGHEAEARRIMEEQSRLKGIARRRAARAAAGIAERPAPGLSPAAQGMPLPAPADTADTANSIAPSAAAAPAASAAPAAAGGGSKPGGAAATAPAPPSVPAALRRLRARLLIGFDLGWDAAARAVVGYGFAPFRALYWLAGLILLAGALAGAAWTEGSMAPANDLVAASESWQAVLARDCLPQATPGCLANPAAEWNGAAGAGVDWEGFHPLAWGTDLVVPVIELGQTGAWAPSAERGRWGFALWWARWPLIVAGWLVSALAAAAATGIIQRSPPS